MRPADAEDLAELLGRLAEETRITVLGAASNVIVRDGGLPGVVLRLGARVQRGHRGGGRDRSRARRALDATVAEHAAEAGLAGLEFLSGDSQAASAGRWR